MSSFPQMLDDDDDEPSSSGNRTDPNTKQESETMKRFNLLSEQKTEFISLDNLTSGLFAGSIPFMSI